MKAQNPAIEIFRFTAESSESFYLYVHVEIEGVYELKPVSISPLPGSTNPNHFQVDVVFLPLFESGSVPVAKKAWLIENLSAYPQLDFSAEGNNQCVIKVSVFDDEAKQNNIGSGVLSQTNAENVTRPVEASIL